MDTPGFDPCSATGQIAGGANLIAFTTGRGSMFGAKPVPSVKLATNTPMYRRLEEDMDINCGEILDGDATMQEMGAAHLRAHAAHRLGREDARASCWGSATTNSCPGISASSADRNTGDRVATLSPDSVP